MNNLSENTRLLIASTLCLAILYFWQTMYVEPMIDEQKTSQQELIDNTISSSQVPHEKSQIVTRDVALKQASRINFENDKVKASINLMGARLDDLILKNYKVSTEEGAPSVHLLSPSQTNDVYFAEFGWLSAGSKIQTPNSSTIWNATSEGESKYSLHWQNPQGVMFKIHLSLNKDYMFDVSQEVVNNSGTQVNLTPYSLISRVKKDDDNENTLIHEGAIGVFGETLHEVSFSDLTSDAKQSFSGQQTDWIGFSDKYWLTALIPSDKAGIKSDFRMTKYHNQDRYQISLAGTETIIDAGSTTKFDSKFFAGAKEIDLLDAYETNNNIKLFDRAVDFGMLYFITKPIFILLHYFYDMIGNFGVAILLLTVFIKLLLFPLAHKGFKGMNRLKDLQPKMTAIKEKYKDKPQEFQKALMDLYRKEKVNPMAGCLPILLQIPIFFALYKVLSVTIEMRHAPFFGWIVDLSVPDPMTFVNLFGLIPWDPPLFLSIGIFPVLMALTMYIQQRLNPEPADPVQAKVMRLMPVVFLFMFASFPSGLVIYWTWSNVLSILQQSLIKKIEPGKK